MVYLILRLVCVNGKQTIIHELNKAVRTLKEKTKKKLKPFNFLPVIVWQTSMQSTHTRNNQPNKKKKKKSTFRLY